jgi:hypothetical protein
MKRHLLSGVAAVVMALPAFAAPHTAYKGQPVDGIPTFKTSHTVGQMIFTKDFPDKSLKNVPGQLPQLMFSKGNPPSEWWGRGYFAGSVGEVMKSIPYSTRNWQLTDHVYIDGKLATRIKSDVDKDMQGWNTVSFEGADINKYLSDLEPGEHKLTIWQQLDYEVKTVEKGTNIVSWEGAYVSLAKGQFTVNVQE